MASASISGLSSGLDTASIISQLMQLEAMPQSRLKTRVSAEESALTKLQAINTRTAGLASKAADLAKESAWARLATTSSHKDVTIAAGPTAGPTHLNVTVTGVASTHQVGFADAHALTDVVTGATTRVVLDRFDGSPLTLETGDGTLSSLVAELNDPANATGVRASAVKVADGQYKLLVESVTTGAAQDFELTAEDGSALLGGATVKAATNASIDLGTGISVTSTTNTFTDVLPGVSVTLAPTTAVGTVASLDATRDTAGIKDSVKSLVDDLNALLGEIATQTAYNSSTKKSGPLAGESALRQLQSALADAVYPTDGTSLAPLGIEMDRNGKLKFDADKFAQAYAADPVGVAAQFTTGTNGFAERVADVAKTASDRFNGTLTAAINGRTSGINRLKDSIESWDARLELRRTALTRQFTALETAMSQMQGQSNWLAGQISSLPTAG